MAGLANLANPDSLQLLKLDGRLSSGSMRCGCMDLRSPATSSAPVAQARLEVRGDELQEDMRSVRHHIDTMEGWEAFSLYSQQQADLEGRVRRVRPSPTAPCPPPYTPLLRRKTGAEALPSL